MKITFIVPTLNVSGGLRVVSIYAQLLAEKRHAVTIVSPKEKSLTFKQRIKHFLKWNGYQFKSHFDDIYFKNVNYKVIVTNKMGSVLPEDVPNADMVIATWWETVEWVNKFPNTKGEKVHFIQGYDAYENLLEERIKQTYLLPFYKITIANWLVALLKTKFQAKHVYLVPNSVDLELFYAEERGKQDRPTIGILFSEIKCKGVDDSLKVIQNLKNTIPNLRVLAFGASLPVNIVLPEYVELTIKPKQDDIRLLYQQCDLWLCCSLSEGFGLTILEAMACRTPAVSTKSGGPEDIITENSNGYLCDVNDISALTNAASKILGFDESQWQVFSENAYKHAVKYTWKDAARLFEKSLQNVMIDDNSYSP